MKKLLFIVLLFPLIFSCTPTELSPGEGIIGIEKEGKKWKGVEVTAKYSTNIPDTWILTISKEGNQNRLTEVLTFTSIPPREGEHIMGETQPGDEPGKKILSHFGTSNDDVSEDTYFLKDIPDNRFELKSFDPNTNEAIGSFKATLSDFYGTGSDIRTITFSSDEFRVIVK